MAKLKSDSVSHFFGGVDDGTATEDSEEITETTENLTATDPEDTIEGEIAVDVHETDTDVVVISPIAGMDPENIEISATDDTITISGERKAEHASEVKNTSIQEIYWGAFSRTVTLPADCDTAKANASFKHGILTIKIPKAAAQKRTIKVKTVE